MSPEDYRRNKLSEEGVSAKGSAACAAPQSVASRASSLGLGDAGPGVPPTGESENCPKPMLGA